MVNFLAGSDDPLLSDCLAPGGGACRTFQAAVDIAQLLTDPDVGGNTIKADCDVTAATYDQAALGPANSIQVYRGLGSIVNFLGSNTSPQNCAITPTITTTIFDVQDGQQATVNGFALGFGGTSNGSTAVSARQLALLDVNFCYFGSNINGTMISAVDISSVNVFTPAINGNAALFMIVTGGSQAVINNIVIPASTHPNITTWFDAVQGGVITGTPAWALGAGATVSGTRFACSSNAVIALSGAYPAALGAGAGGGSSAGLSGPSGCVADPL